MDSYSINLIMETLSWLGFFTAIILSFYFYLRFRNRERMALIDKGADVTEIFKSRDFSFKFPWLRLGILSIGIGSGALLGYLFIVSAPMEFRGNNHEYEEFILISILLISGGLSVIIGNIVERSRNKRNG